MLYSMTTMTAYASYITLARLGGAIQVADGSGRTIGTVDLIHGFAHYRGAVGTAHEGVTAVVRGGVDGLTEALRVGLRNGRDDRT